MPDRHTTRRARDRGFTLVEIVVAIALVGVLSAAVVVGVGALTNDASSAGCSASADAAQTATNTFFVGAARYPVSFLELTAAPSGPNSGEAPMRAPDGATVTAGAIATSQWTLSMSSTTPPTFTCSNGPPGTSGTNPTTSTAPSGGNGVTVSARADYGQIYYGESILTLTNPAPLTALTATVQIAQTVGVTAHGEYDNFPAGAVDAADATAAGVITFTFTLAPGQTIPAGSWTLDAQTDGTTTLHPTAGDSWTVVATSGGVETTLTGGF